jgi:hypothetical protein
VGALPQTAATTIVQRVWVDPPLDELATSDVALAEVLTLARWDQNESCPFAATSRA